MKKKLTKKYMIVFITSVVLIVVIWVLLSYIFIFAGKDANINEPQYLVNRFEQYVNFENDISISSDGKQIIKENALWVQIIDKYGNVLTSYNTNDNIPDRYDVFEIINDSLTSNVIKNQTIFVSSFVEHSDMGVIIGCDSSKVNKYNFKLTGGVKEAIIKSLFVLIIIFVIIGILSGITFSKSISKPVQDIIDNINSLENDKELVRFEEKSMYYPVYDSIRKLRNRLNEDKIERIRVEKQREDWISNISHDIKTPLTTIKGYAEIMAEQDYEVSAKEQAKYSDIIKRNANVIEGLVKDLNFSKMLKAGKVTMKNEQINVCNLLTECCDSLHIKYRDKIKCNCESEKIYITADKKYIQRVFMNIIYNAFMHNNGDVNVVINCYEKDDVIVEIIDDGKGMSKEEMDNIFSRYYRGKNSKEIEGCGLGMAISNEIVKAHNGRIEVESEINQGSKFVVYLKK